MPLWLSIIRNRVADSGVAQSGAPAHLLLLQCFANYTKMPKSTLHTDFKHRKQKVGKRKLIPANVTSTVFSWKTLTTGSKNPSTETTKDGCSSLDEVLAACRNHNATSRREGLVHLVSFVGRDVRQTQLHLSRLVLAIADRIVDPEAPVRAATVAALQSVLAACAPEAMLSFIPLLAAYLASALSKLLPSLRLDALAHVLMLAQVRGACCAPHPL